MKALLLALGLALPASAGERDTLVYAHVGDLTSLDPAYPYDANSQGLIYNVVETLIAFDGSRLDKFTPVLATAVPSRANGLISKDGRSYAFPIRRGVRFHDGRELTPEDVRYSLLRFMLQDRAGGPSALLLEPILGVPSTRGPDGKIALDFAEAERAVRVEDGKVVVALKQPFAPFLAIMARWSYVVSKSWAVENGDWDGRAETWKAFNNPDKAKSPFYDKMNGTGPFKLERWDRVGKQAILARNDSYWRKPAALKRVVMKTVDEFSTRRLLLQGGGVDVADVPRSFLSQLGGLKEVVVQDDLTRLTTDPVLFFTFKVNPEANPDIGSGKLDGEGIPPDFFSDPDVRKGFAYAFDHAAFIRDSFKGKAIWAKAVVPPALLGGKEPSRHFDYDLKKAEAHLRRAWGGKAWEKGFSFTLTYNTGGEMRETACAILKKNLEALNPRFHVRVRGIEWASYLDRAERRQMPMFSRGWLADYPDPHNFVFAFYHSHGRYALAQSFSDPELDRLVDEALREVDPARRRALYLKLEDKAFDVAPQITTVHPPGALALRREVRGFVDNPVVLGIWFYPISKD